MHFPDAWISGYESLTPKMMNDVKDRHVVACAVQIGARLIVTFNVRHFPAVALDPLLIEAQHPDDFLVNMYRLHPEILVHVLHEQARAIRWELGSLLVAQRQGTPKFVQLVADDLSLEF
jgi:hypothetical protein